MTNMLKKKKKYPLFLQEKKIDIMGGELQERFENSQQQKATNGIPRRKNATSKIKNLLNRINSSSNNGRKYLLIVISKLNIFINPS